MIQRFRKVDDHLYRGSKPSIEDVIFLQKKFKITKIVSLDQIAGQKIDRACKLLNIKHIMLPIEFNNRGSLLNFLKQDIEKLLTDKNGNVFVHCSAGKDRTGIAIAMYRCEHDHWSCGKALKEARQLGYGIGVPENVLHLYNKILKTVCGCEKNTTDINSAYDIVSNERDDDHIGGSSTQLSWSPYEDYAVRQFPYANTDRTYSEQYPNRENYGLDDSGMDKDSPSRGMPQSGTYDTSSEAIVGFGPSLVGGGYV